MFLRKVKSIFSKDHENGYEMYDGSLEDSSGIDEPTPRFFVGDEVHIYNPYVGAIYADDKTRVPFTYKIVESKFDDVDKIFRYKLEGPHKLDWVSEDWVTLPTVSSFTKKFDENSTKLDEYEKCGKIELSPESLAAEKKLMGRLLEEQARIRSIDRLLDIVNDGTESEKEDALRQLKELTDDFGRKETD
jgi:hypothetical protein